MTNVVADFVNGSSYWDLTGESWTSITFQGQSGVVRSIGTSLTSARLINIDSDTDYNLTLKNLEINDFKTEGFGTVTGGAVRAVGVDSSDDNVGIGLDEATVTNVIFSNNTALSTLLINASRNARGGALMLHGGYILETGIEITPGGNTATIFGSAFVGNMAKLTNEFTTGDSITSNAAGGAGAIVYFNEMSIGDTAVLNNTAQGKNIASVSGGGFYVSGVREGAIVDSVFENNTAILDNDDDIEGTSGGGALLLTQFYGIDDGVAAYDAGKYSLEGVDFLDNRTLASGAQTGAIGGAIYVARNAVVDVQDGEFIGNSAVSEGNVAWGGAVAINNYIQTEDTLNQEGTKRLNQVSTFTDSTFLQNTADGESGALGGAIFSNQALELDNVNFIGNSAETETGNAAGGAIYYDNDLAGARDLRVRDSSFLNNFADTASAAANEVSRGGAIYANGADVRLRADDENMYFLGNQADEGGAIYANDGKVRLYADDANMFFFGNQADEGASIYAHDGLGYRVNDGQFIVDLDGIRVYDGVNKYGNGTLALLGLGGETHFMDELDVHDGLLLTNIINGESSIRVDYGINGGNGDGTASFAQGSNWYVSLLGIDQSDMDLLRGDGVLVTDMGWDGLADVNAALINNDPLYYLFADVNGDEEGVLRLAFRNQALISDVFNSAYLMHRTNTVRNAGTERINRGFASQRQTARYTGCSTSGCAKPNCCVPKLSTHSLWVNYVARSSELESSYARFGGRKYKMNSNGIQLGVDLITNRCTQFGILFGYEDMENKLAHDRVEAEDYYFGLYGARMLSCGYDIRGMFGYGRQNYDVSRYHYSSVSSLFNRMYEVSPDGRTFEGNIELGRRIQRRCLSYRPYLALDYFNNDIDGADEGLGGFEYAGGKFEQIFLRVGTDLQLQRNRWNLHGGVSYSYQMLSDGEQVATGVSRGLMHSTLRSSDLGNSIVSLNAGVNYALGRTRSWNVFAGYFGDIYTDREGSPMDHTGQIGLQRRF